MIFLMLTSMLSVLIIINSLVAYMDIIIGNSILCIFKNSYYHNLTNLELCAYLFQNPNYLYIIYILTFTVLLVNFKKINLLEGLIILILLINLVLFLYSTNWNNTVEIVIKINILLINDLNNIHPLLISMTLPILLITYVKKTNFKDNKVSKVHLLIGSLINLVALLLGIF